MVLARGLPTPVQVTNPPAGRDVVEGMADTQQSLVGRLASGEVILGDGSYIMTLEKRGYATAGSWTPEAAASPTQLPYIEESSADLGQLRNQDCFYEHLLSFVRRSLPAWSGVVL